MPEAKTGDPLAHLRLLTIKEICALTRYTPQHIYRLMRAGKFPQRIRIGDNRVGWRLTEIEAWFASRPTVVATIDQSEARVT
ncbi:MAG: AlpA family phage regulatory protein [Hyphomicrobium sp.]|nr:AlpA family phage regulatory protein [Hyphomicrobium sp.]